MVDRLDDRAARWELASLAAFASWPVRAGERGTADSAARQALRALIAEHQAAPLPAPDAYVEAVRVLEEHGAPGEYVAWRAAVGDAAGRWPTQGPARPRAV